MNGEMEWTYDPGFSDPVEFSVLFDWNERDNRLDIEAMEVQGVDVLGVLSDDVVTACEKAVKRRLRRGRREDDDARD